jgi:hypothetical protein
MKKLLMTTMLVAGFMMISSVQGANALMTQSQPIVIQQSHVTPVYWHRWGGGWHHWRHHYWRHWGW